MKRIFPLLAVLLISLFYLFGAASTPFHPDEATQIFMSSDVNQNPAQLFWQPGAELDPRQRYRELDAPLTRTLIGLGLWVTRTPGLETDWDWSKTWQQNQAAGALPSARTLLVSRLSLMLLFPFTLWLMFLNGKKLAGTPGAWGALLLTATNAYLLLHTRRAMAEGVLLFCIALAIWCLLSLIKYPWLMGIAIALAINAKQSTAPFLLVGMAALCWPIVFRSWRTRLRDIALFSLLMIGITFLLNPFLWRDPFHAGQAALAARSDLLARQVAEVGAQTPGMVLTSPLSRLGAMTAQLFFTPLAVADVGNYLLNTQATADAYLANQFNTLLRSPTGGAVLLLIALLGLIVAMRILIKQKSRSMAILLAATILQALFLIIFFPIPWQRYYLPLLPWIILLSACLLAPLTKTSAQGTAQRSEKKIENSF